MLDWKSFFRAAGIRAVRTMAQCALACMGSAVLLDEVNWWSVISSSILGGVMSILMAVATGLPETPDSKDVEDDR